MLVVFRADASLEIGTGHVMRCLTLADALRAKGAECRFVCRQHPGNLAEAIESRGFLVDMLPVVASFDRRDVDASGEHAGWLGDSLEQDALQTRACMRGRVADWLVIDHYAISEPWERQIDGSAKRLMVIDDLANRLHQCDLLMDQNLGRNEESYRHLVPGACRIFAGPKYALLRNEFPMQRAHSLARRQHPRLGRLLIAMGGVDKDNATGTILKALAGAGLPADCCISVVLGRHCPWIDEVNQLASDLPWQTDIHVDAQNMAVLMADSDLAIGGAGSTSWERCCLGVPSIQVVLASNQREIAAALQAAGAAITVELSELAGSLAKVIARVCESSVVIGAMSMAAAGVTTGRGATLVSDYMLRVTADEN